MSHHGKAAEIDAKYAEARHAALEHVKQTNAKRRSKKHHAGATKSTTPSPIEDFVLFPEDKDTQSSNKHKERSKSQRKPKDDSKSASSPTSSHPANQGASARTGDERPKKVRAPRHGGFKIEPLVEEGETSSSRSFTGRPPPAPRPPPLDSPTLSALDDDVWAERNDGLPIQRRRHSLSSSPQHA